MSEYIKISDVMKIYKSLYNGYGTTASFNVPVFVDLLRTVAVEFPEPPKREDDAEMKDNVNHPDHYKSGKYECIEVMKDILTEEQMTGFCLGNALKYLWRAGKKDDFTEDIYKAIWYLNYLTGAQSEDEAE